VEQRQGALGIAELASPDEVERLGKRNSHRLDHLVGLGPARHGLEVEGGEEEDALVGEARRGPDPAQLFDAPGPAAGLFLEFACGAALWRLARLELAGGHLENRSAGRVPVLTNQQHLIVREKGHHGRRSGVRDDVDLHQRSVGKRHPLGVDAHHEAAFDLFRRRHRREVSPDHS